MDAGKGVLVVWLIGFLILGGIESYIEIHVGTRFSSFDGTLWEKAAVLALYFANYYVLIIRGHGINFEREEFKNLKKTRKVLLILSFAVLLLATIVFTNCSRTAYKRYFHL